ncbi:MAG TPA: circularly permuted type 2 ATP-grasp protein [Chthoniobacter sp.]|nr:circularly permuted type 2 ATP-grasp protein [Chthoniobacter sp.]
MPSPSGVWAAYRPRPDVFDEMRAPNGVVRPHWLPLVQGLERLGREGIKERSESASQLLREHGVTYNVHADGESAERRWGLDVLPLIISAEEWAHLEAGLIQRTRLLNLVLADIYGPQQLLRDGLLPPAMLHANPGFLRCCHGIRPPRDLFLSLHAVDLTRAPNGQWWVLSDRTQAPSGVGYALENRAILSRILPDEFRESQVQRLGEFFKLRKAGLRSLAPWTSSPHIVLLTAGPYSETYFEHAYLARYLGYQLVEGNDLTVRDQCVFLKTLEGLQRVDVIVRRVDDTWCDPLELRADSILGVPGLVEAARAGNVAISNALGTGAVETTAILAFLPALSRHLLKEKLRIPNVATWWCGQESERNYALWALNSLVTKRAFVGGHGEPSFGRGLGAPELGDLAARIHANPHAYVTQESVALSTAPVWHGEAPEPRPLILRCYVCATEDGFTVMPGGLTRVSPSADSPIVSSRYGGGSKDTWVRSSTPMEPTATVETAPTGARPEARGVHVPSRVAENLFWLGRYAERLEDTTRILRTALSRLAGEGGPTEEEELVALARWLARMEMLPPRFARRFTPSELASELREMVFERNRFGTIRELLDRVSFLTNSVRDCLSGDTWRILHQLQTDFPASMSRATPGAILHALHRLIFQLAAFSGMEMENMSRGHAWRFLDIGRRLERAINLISNVRAVLATDGGCAALPPLLEYTDSTMTYRRRYLARPEMPTTFALLLTDASNPRSLAYQFETLGQHLAGLPGADEGRPEQGHFEDLRALLVQTDIFDLTKDGAPRPLLRSRLDEFFDGSCNLSDLLSASYFSHVPARVS